MATTVASVQPTLQRTGFAFVAGRDVEAWLGPSARTGWPAFSASWDDLPLDTHLLELGLRRRRRHAVFSISPDGAIAREAHQAHYQTRYDNPLQGGIERWFEPVDRALGDGDALRGVLGLSARVFGAPPAGDAWRVEVHQFRIEARADEPGRPTPEGVHRDGVDHVLVLLVARRNVASGTTTIHAPGGALLGSFTLAEPFDVALVDDTRVAHGVTPIHAVDPAAPAYRDVLVVTLARGQRRLRR